MNKTK